MCPSPCLVQPLHIAVPQYIVHKWVSVYALDDEREIITLSVCLECYHWGQSSKIYKSFYFSECLSLDMNFRCLALWSLNRNLIWWFPCACVIVSDFILRFHWTYAARTHQIVCSPPPHHQLAHKEVNFSGLWLFTKSSAEKFLILHFSLALSLGVPDSPLADSRIPFLDICGVVLDRFVSKVLWWAEARSLLIASCSKYPGVVNS